ncbi:MAG: hypothetical protein WEE36_10565 [Acidimicrobiia bacterium]
MSENADREPLSSEDMIERARGRQTASSESLIEQAKNAVSETPDIGLGEIEVSIPVADNFPKPLPTIQTGRPRRVVRPPARLPQGPISTDKAPRAVVIAVAVFILLIAVGVAVAALTAVP